jgi:ribosome-associated toxin RatA of RatAB toxin-antitoxin module
MHRVERSVIVPYPAEQMFTLVAAVDDYPRFLPWCSAAHAFERPDGLVEATISIDYRGVRTRFTTHNQNLAPEHIRIDLVDGPFRRLHGIWTFKRLRAAGCKVQLQLHYQFATGLFGRAIAPVFENIAGSLVDSFGRRADALYGQSE